MTQFFMAEPDPEEIERAHAAHMAGAHAVNRLLEELDEDQFGALMLIFDSISLAPNPVKVAAYLSGRITQRAQERFGICAACNKNHDREAADLLAPKPPAEDEAPPFTRARQSSTEIHFLPIGTRGPLTVPEQNLMQEYGLDDLRDEDSHKLVGFICINCKMQYPTIQDRMQRPPGVENCDGCVQKTKFG